MYIKHHKPKDIVIVPKHNENQNIQNLNKFDIKSNHKSYENIKKILFQKNLKNKLVFFF